MKKEYLSKMHGELLFIMDEIDRVCRGNDIEYFLLGGSALGAVRHKGFIPWDDDMDVGMTRDNYEKFEQVSNQLNPVLYFDDYKRNKKYNRPHAQVCKRGSRIIKSREYYKEIDDTDVFVDIFPLDCVPQSEAKQKRQRKRVMRLKYLQSRKQCIIYQRNTAFQIFLKKCFKLMLAPISFYRLGKWLDDASKKYNGEGGEQLSSMSSSADYYTDFFPLNWLSPPIEAEFEGRRYFIPRDCDKLLTRCYGDYMTPVRNTDLRKQPDMLSILDIGNYYDESKPCIVGYTTGVFDMFHIGHLNILKRAKENCDYLIVGVTTDELALEYKNIQPAIPFEERCEIINSIKYVDKVVPQISMDKLDAYEKYKFDVMFHGDDWKGTEIWNAIEKEFGKRGVKIMYFPYTKSTSSTKLREFIDSNKESKS